MSPDITRTNLLRGAMRREGASSPPVPPLPLDTPSEVERRERRSKVGSKYSVTIMKGSSPHYSNHKDFVYYEWTFLSELLLLIY